MNLYISTLLNRFIKTDAQRTIATAIALACMMLFVSLLSYFFFLNQSLRLDEAQSLWQTTHTPLAVFNIVAQDVHVPLYHELLHMWRLYIGDSVQSCRVMSLVFFILSIPALYFLGKKSYGRSLGLWAALLLTVSPFMNWYGNEIRMYSLFALVTIVNQYYFIEIWKDPKRDTWFWYAFTAILGVFSHYFFFLSLAAQALFYFLRSSLFPRGSFKKFVITAILVLVSFAPWVLYVFHVGDAGNQTPLLTLPTTVNLFGVFQQFLIGFQVDSINTIFLSLWPFTLVFAFLALQRHRRMTSETEYFMLAVFIPILLAFGISFVVTPLFVSRYLILVIPAFYLCLLSLFDSFPLHLGTFFKVLLVGLMLLTMGIEITSSGTPVKENYREASEYIAAHATPQDAVIISAPFTLYPIEYYYHGLAPVSTLPLWNQFETGAIPPFSEATLPAQVASSTEGVQDVWLLLSYDQGYQENIKQYFDSHYQRLFVKVFSPDMTLYVYKIRYNAPLSSTPASL